MESQQDCQTRVCKNGHTLGPVGNSQRRWRCDGRLNPDGCAGGITNFNEWNGVVRYRCGLCNYDLCEKCYFHCQLSTATKTSSENILEISVELVSSDPLATLMIPDSATGAAVKSALRAHISSSSFVQALATEDGDILEDSSTLSDLKFPSVGRLIAALAEFQWEGHWAPICTNDTRTGDYMELTGTMRIEAQGHVYISQPRSAKSEYCFKGDPPLAGNDEFTVISCGNTDALSKMIIVRLNDDVIRATHAGTFFSWLRAQSAFIEYKRWRPDEPLPKFM